MNRVVCPTAATIGRIMLLNSVCNLPIPSGGILHNVLNNDVEVGKVFHKYERSF